MTAILIGLVFLLFAGLRMTRRMPIVLQKRTAAALVVFACTERWIGTAGQRSRTSAMRPGSASTDPASADPCASPRMAQKASTAMGATSENPMSSTRNP